MYKMTIIHIIIIYLKDWYIYINNVLYIIIDI